MASTVSFSDLGVERCLVQALDNKGITEPFEVQLEAIPDGMLGRDVCCRAPTGSGKTLAFGLPLLTRSHSQANRRLSNSVSRLCLEKKNKPTATVHDK